MKGGGHVTTTLAQAVLLRLLYLLFRRLIRDPARQEERLLAFLFVGIGVASVALAAKLQLLGYFSDAVSFQLLRNLGGGSLIDAALFGLSESVLYVVAIVGALAVFVASRRWLRRRASRRVAPSTAPAAFSWRGWSVLLLAAAIATFAADRILSQPGQAFGEKRVGVHPMRGEANDAVAGEKASSDVYVDASTLKNQRATVFAAQGSLLVEECKLLHAFDRRLGEAGWRQPTFAYVNFQSAHFPYHHPGMVDLVGPHPLPRGDIGFAERYRVARTYWNAVAYADARLAS